MWAITLGASILAIAEAVHEKLTQLEKQQRSLRVEKIELGPEVSVAREAWLAVYNAYAVPLGRRAHLSKPASAASVAGGPRCNR
jgi:hypothetical protein